MAGYALIAAILVGWVVFVARHQPWRIGHRALVGIVGAVVIAGAFGYTANALFAM